MLFQLSRPLLIAHRGASSAAPENTMAAFNLAIEQGAEALELDAKLSADGEVVVIHDQSVDRTTNGSGRVDQLSLQKIKTFDAGSWFPETGRFAGERIPTLDEVLGAFGRSIIINIELTNYATIFDQLPIKVVNLIRRHNLNDRVFFSSFNPIALARAHAALPKIPCGMLALAGKPGRIARDWLRRLPGISAIHPEKGDMTPELVSQAHHARQFVFAYTVNQAIEMRRLFKLNADGLFTDDIPLAQHVLQEMGLNKH
jgi:glycerophosphoryl diester phosphodiesterase